jgi:SAM-dependent methyltransferase
MTLSPVKPRSSAPHKLQEYAEIFDARGQAYHEAMLRFPEARAEEFNAILNCAGLKDGQTVCDYPSGGGYLEGFIKPSVDLVLLETSKVFFACAAEHSRARRLLVEDGKIPMESHSADRFISLAGLHHLADKRPFFREVHRALKPGGAFALADAFEGSGVAGFLNEFVHEHSEAGHEGIFLNGGTRYELEDCGFNIGFMQPISYGWNFSSIEEMCEYCRLMFGVTRATPAQTEAAIRRYLGITESGGKYRMGWELLFITAGK